MEETSDHSQNVASEANLQSRPEVYQCNKCQRILGDSLSLIAYNHNLESLTVAISHKEDQELKGQAYTPELISMSGVDKGCVYDLYKCPGCSEKVGKQYLTTLRAFDHLREGITLDLNKITIHRLGGAQSGENGPITFEGRVIQSEDDITKLKDFCLIIAERMDAMELYVQDLILRLADYNIVQAF